MFGRVNLKIWDGTRKSFDLQVIKETPEWLVGWRLDKEGESSDQMEAIDKSAIVRRTPMRMNLHYGELEPIDNPILVGTHSCYLFSGSLPILLHSSG